MPIRRQDGDATPFQDAEVGDIAQIGFLPVGAKRSDGIDPRSAHFGQQAFAAVLRRIWFPSFAPRLAGNLILSDSRSATREIFCEVRPMSMTKTAGAAAKPAGKNLLIQTDGDGIAWVKLNRPEKRNAINPGIVYEMVEALDALEVDDACKCVVITGAGDAFSAGQDLKEYFREPDAGDPMVRERLYRANAAWQWRRLLLG